MTQLLKFCVKCEHHRSDVFNSAAKCHHSESEFINLVTGESEFRTCDGMRFLKCGPEAKLYKEKDAA